MSSKLWAFLNTDIKDIFSADTVTGGVEAAKAIIEFSKKLEENKTKLPELVRMLSPVSSLLDVLNSPLVEITGAGLPFIAIATKLLTFYLEKTQKDPTLAQCVALVSQAAFLESLKYFLKNDPILLNRIGHITVSKDIQDKIKLLEKIKISDDDAKNAVTCFHESKLAKVFENVLFARLIQAGLSTNKAKVLTLRVKWNTHRYMILAWAESGEAVKHLAQPSFAEWREEQEKYQSITDYLTEKIATQPLENVFAEEFTFEDIYVPLKAQSVHKLGKFHIRVELVNLETWAKETIFSLKNKDKVLFIQAGPGRGKSLFCQMFADWVRQQLYPIWIPILIRLRDIPNLQNSFRETLREAVNANFASDNNWLTDRNTRYLFFLDGFDELIIEGRNSSGLELFLRQVEQFQKDSAMSKDMGHRVIVTGRTLALQGVKQYVRDNFAQVTIKVMDEDLKQQWLSRWQKLVGTDKKDAFEEFLQDENCTKQVKELAQEPLLLYLLAAMHRDGKLNLEAFQETNETQAKIVIYEESLDWVLTQQRPQSLQNQITGLDTEDLRCILIEAGLCVVQSGGEYTKFKMIEERLDNDIVKPIKKARSQGGDQVLKNALAAFYLKPAAADNDGGVEFFHKSFSEFLCAKRLQESLIEWTKPGKRGRGYNLKDEQFYEEVYDLLGYGGLTPEIVEYLMGLLIESEAFPFSKLFERLEYFYLRWSDGEFIDSPTGTIPKKKCQKLQQHDIKLGQRQVDVYTGLNVMILLLELHRYGQQQEELKDKLMFHPCGQLNSQGKLEDEFRLYRIIGYSCCVGESCFLETVGQFFGGANLSGASLRGADLSGADLSGADLSDTDLLCIDLSDTNLLGANLRCAHLMSASLNGANFCGTDLSEANLILTDLFYANLSSANLHGADLSDANLRGANLENIQWDEYTNWENVGGLETAMNVPEALKRQLGL
ncbi:MAG: pentapeptide repeat-containing protein [Microcoleaceae cyanobacterium]